MPLKTNRVVVLVIGVSLLSLCSCSTTFHPRPDRRISLTMNSGVPTLERDGLKFGATPFSNDPLRAVQGNAAAEEHARTYLWRSRVGLGLVAGGLAMITTAVLLLPNARDDSNERPPAGIAPPVFMLSGLAACFISLPFAFSAQPHLWDAVNIYNDGVTPQ